MPWPPILPPDTRTNATPVHDNHPNDHNIISDALSDIVFKINNPPFYLAVKQTQPTAADYGLSTIPVNAVWVQTP